MTKDRWILPAAIVLAAMLLAGGIITATRDHDNTLRCVALYKEAQVAAMMSSDGTIRPRHYDRLAQLAKVYRCRYKLHSTRRRASP